MSNPNPFAEERPGQSSRERYACPTKIAETVLERLPLAKVAGGRVARPPQYADTRVLRRLLRLGGERRRDRGDTTDDEGAAGPSFRRIF